MSSFSRAQTPVAPSAPVAPSCCLRYQKYNHLSNSTLESQSLVQNGQKYLSLMGIHHRHCHGAAFALDPKGNPLQLFIKSRIIIDAAFFRKMNPNYTRPSVSEINNTKPNNGFCIDLCSSLSSTPPDIVKDKCLQPKDMTKRDLLICCPTVLGFSFTDKGWCTMLSELR